MTTERIIEERHTVFSDHRSEDLAQRTEDRRAREGVQGLRTQSIGIALSIAYQCVPKDAFNKSEAEQATQILDCAFSVVEEIQAYVADGRIGDLE